jgi:predicted ATP-binding protein involved in virulence
MIKGQANIATYFKSLELKNVRCFGTKQKLDLTNDNGELAQWTLILGDNGAGKTTLLQCLVWMRPVIVDEPREGVESAEAADETSNVKSSITVGTLGPAITDENNDTVESLCRIGGKPEIWISAVTYQGDNLVFNKAPRGKQIKTTVRSKFDSNNHLKWFKSSKTDIVEDLRGEFWEPFIIGYGANRQMGSRNASNIDLQDPLATRLSVVTELYDAVERLTKLHHAVVDQETKNRENPDGGQPESVEARLLRTFKQALADILPEEVSTADVIDIEAPKLVEGELKDSEVKIRSLSRHVPFTSLSLGYQTTLAWALDLSWRLFTEYPDSLTPLEEPAIVLIDEIDLHLHPLWQWQIMSKLANVFKRTQFIATAHSPLMVQSMPNSNFAVVHKIEDSEVRIENNPEKVKGWRVDQILNSEYFSLPFSRPPETEKLFEERAKLLRIPNRTKSQDAKLKQLEKQIQNLPTAPIAEEREAVGLLKQVTQLLKDNGSSKR